jgi:hypothetical protein
MEAELTTSSSRGRFNDYVATFIAISSLVVSVFSIWKSAESIEAQKKLATFNTILDFNKKYYDLHIDFRTKIEKDNKDYTSYDFYRQHWGLEGSAFRAWFYDELIPDETFALWMISQKADYKRNALKVKGTSYRDGYEEIKRRYLTLVKRSGFYDLMDNIFEIKSVTIFNDSFYNKNEKEKILNLLNKIKKIESGRYLDLSNPVSIPPQISPDSSSVIFPKSAQTPLIKSPK